MVGECDWRWRGKFVETAFLNYSYDSNSEHAPIPSAFQFRMVDGVGFKVLSIRNRNAKLGRFTLKKIVNINDLAERPF